MSKSIEAKAVISAEDKTGQIFDKVAKKIQGLTKTAKAFEGVKAPQFTGDMFEELRRLRLTEKELQGVRKSYALFDQQLKGMRPKFELYVRAHNDWKSKVVGHWREVKAASEDAHLAQQKFMRTGALSGWISAGAAGYYGGRAARYALDRSREANRETTKQRQAGLTQAQSDAIADEAERQSQRYPSISQTELRSAGREAVMQMGSQEAGLKMMPVIGRFMTAGKVLWGSDRIDEQTRKALQVLDARQITDPERANSLLDAMIRSSQVQGGPDFKADDLRTALRYGRIMTQGQSDRFVTGVLPQLGVDLGYSQAGTGLMSAHSALIGGRQTDAAEQFQRKVGLRDDRGLIGKDVFLRDVDKWVDAYLIPTMQRAKVDVDSPSAVGEFLGKFLTRTPADVLGNLVNSRQQRARNREQQDLATGMAGAERLHTQDVGVALEGVNSQLANMASSAKLAEAAISGLNGAMGLIQEAGKKLNEPGGWFDQGKKQFENEKRDASAVIGAIKWVADLDRKISDPVKGWLTGDIRSSSQAARTGFRKLDPPRAMDAWPVAGAGPVPWSPGGAPSGTYVPASTTWSDFFRTGSARLGTARRYGPPTFPAPQITDTTTYGTGVGGDRSIEVHGEVTGEIKGQFTAVAGDSLVKLVEETKQLNTEVRAALSRWGANGPGSRGISSPDASPGARGFGGAGAQPY